MGNNILESLYVTCRLDKLVKDPTEGNAWHADHIIPVYKGGGKNFLSPDLGSSKPWKFDFMYVAQIFCSMLIILDHHSNLMYFKSFSMKLSQVTTPLHWAVIAL